MAEHIAGISIIIMLVCFNAGLYIVNASGLYTSPQIPEGQTPDELYGSSIIAFVATFSLVLGVSVGIAIVGGLVGADPLRIFGISLFCTSMLVMLNNSYGVLMDAAQSLTSATIATTVIGIFTAFEAIMVLIFIIQLATGGWASNK